MGKKVIGFLLFIVYIVHILYNIYNDVRGDCNGESAAAGVCGSFGSVERGL